MIPKMSSSNPYDEGTKYIELELRKQNPFFIYVKCKHNCPSFLHC